MQRVDSEQLARDAAASNFKIRVAQVNSASASVIFVMAHYDVHCQISIRSGRAFDVFNDGTTRFLELENVRFFQRTCNEPMLEVNRTVLVKDNVHLAILMDEDRSNERKVFFATREKKTMQGVISLPTVIVKGEVHVKAASDAQGFLSIEAASFFPVTDATVLGYSSAAAPLNSTVVLVKKDAISSLALLRAE